MGTATDHDADDHDPVDAEPTRTRSTAGRCAPRRTPPAARAHLRQQPGQRRHAPTPVTPPKVPAERGSRSFGARPRAASAPCSADGERPAPVRAAAAAARGAHLDPRGARRDGVRRPAGHAARQGDAARRPARRAGQGPARRGGLRRDLRPVLRAGEGGRPDDVGHGHGHGHDDLSDEGALEDFTLSEEPSDTPQQGHSTASRSTSATTSTPTTWPSSTTCTRRPTRSTWPR